MDTAILNNKGQITIPSALRKKLGLEAGAKLRIFSASGSSDLKLSPTGSIQDLAGCLSKPKKPLSIEEMNDATGRGAVEDCQ
jgi:AbrB family looped-hinge helix DNA binding protein